MEGVNSTMIYYKNFYKCKMFSQHNNNKKVFILCLYLLIVFQVFIFFFSMWFIFSFLIFSFFFKCNTVIKGKFPKWQNEDSVSKPWLKNNCISCYPVQDLKARRIQCWCRWGLSFREHSLCENLVNNFSEDKRTIFVKFSTQSSFIILGYKTGD
jgi:hypothetical protein